MKLFFSVLLMTLCGALGAFFLKAGAAKKLTLGSLFTTPKIWVGGCFYVAGALINIALLRHYAYSTVYPLTALTYVWSLLFSVLLLHERLTVQKCIGIAAICVGSFLLVH